MKKSVAAILAALMMMSLSACMPDDHSIGIIGGADGPTAIIVSGGSGSDSDTTSGSDSVSGSDSLSEPDKQPEISTVLPAEIVTETTYNNDEYCTYNLTVNALDEKGDVIWTYVTPKSPVAQCESLQCLAMKNGLVFISEIGVNDGSGDEMDFNTHRLRALNASDGSVAWDNTDFYGAGANIAFDEEGNIYAVGYFGPDCIKISKDGKTLWCISSIDQDLYWAYYIEYSNGEVAVSFEMNENGEDQTVRISSDGEIIG